MVLINQSFHGSMRVCAHTYTQVSTIGGLREREFLALSSFQTGGILTARRLVLFDWGELNVILETIPACA